jgi:hypothetical protein
MATPITRAAHPKALWPGVHKFVMDDYAEHPLEYKEIFNVETSKMAYEEDVEVSGFGLAQVKAEGASTAYDSHAQGVTTRYTHVAYSLGYIVTREELDDNLYKGRSFKRGKMLNFSFRTTKEIVAANVLNRAFNSAYAGGDGKELIATDHPSLAGDWSNELAIAADLSEASLETMLTQINSAKNSRGLPIAIRGQKLVVAPANMFEAERIMNSTLRVGTPNNDVNAIKSMGLLPGGVVVNHYLTDPDAWFIKTDTPDGLTMFQRTPYEFTQDNDFDTMNAKAKGYERYSVGWSDPRGLFGSPGA